MKGKDKERRKAQRSTAHKQKKKRKGSQVELAPSQAKAKKLKTKKMKDLTTAELRALLDALDQIAIRINAENRSWYYEPLLDGLSQKISDEINLRGL